MGLALIVTTIVISIIIYIIIGYVAAKLMEDVGLIYEGSYMDDDDFGWVVAFWIFVLIFALCRKAAETLYDRASDLIDKWEEKRNKNDN